MVAKNIEGRQKAFDAIEKLIAQDKPIRFIDISKKIEVPSTTIKRVYDENFKGKGVIGRARNSNKIIDEIIKTGVLDKDEIKKIAKEKYKVNIEDRNIIKKLNIATDATVEQYVDDLKKMVADPNYVSKYIKPAKEVGEPANLRAAKSIVANETENFKLKYDRNIANTKRKKRDADPEKRTQDLASKAERRVTRRIKEKDVALTPREKNINLEQRKLAKEYNAPIRKNPNLVLGNKELMEKLSITVSKDGDIIKVPTGLTEKYLSERGLFEIDHQRDIYKKGRGKNLPANRNLIAGPYNRTGGFKDMAEKFIVANPDSPKIESILKQAEDLKITLQPDVPTGTFKTKGIGYKQASDPLEKFKQVYESEPKGSPIRKGMDDIVKCADGCFVKVANKNPEKTLNKLNKEPQKLIRLFRGESFPNRTNPEFKAIQKISKNPLNLIKKDALAGQFFTSKPDMASKYTNKLGRTKYVDVSPAEYLKMQEYAPRINKTNSILSNPDNPVRRYPINSVDMPNPDSVTVAPRYKIKQLEKAGRMKSKLNLLGEIENPAGTLIFDSTVGGFIDPADPTKLVSQEQIKTWAQDNPMPVRVGEEPLKVATNKSVLKNVGRTLATIGAPLPTALLDGYFINEQVKEGKGTAEIASNPLNWLGLATMSTLSDISGVSKPGKLNAALRLGLNPGTIRGISRFAGLPGLAVSTAMTAYDQYKKYQNEEGFIYNLFNKEEK